MLWMSLYYKDSFLSLVNLAVIRIFIINIDTSLKMITLNCTADFVDCRCRIHKFYLFYFKMVSYYDKNNHFHNYRVATNINYPTEEILEDYKNIMN